MIQQDFHKKIVDIRRGLSDVKFYGHIWGSEVNSHKLSQMLYDVTVQIDELRTELETESIDAEIDHLKHMALSTEN